ncbi:uncharacterized protein N7484_008251 [Penicillium longicatenatum]|uniref:uncharacterized protein n=1 Tax=Penicillium longicatenatum TaxID=1561947 RepID=UPI002546FA1F|nr:uncharacterized protein N7484_008251 [Penicillium longicatenatum]KAJ5634938.1 hypothetical protein N7484_008251 [Penicillium longicatenatum]
MGLNDPDSCHRTALWYAVDRGDINEVIFLFKCGGDPSVADYLGVTCLQVALKKGKSPMAALMLAYLDDMSTSQIIQNGLPLEQLLLRHSKRPNNSEIMEMLLDLDANVNAKNSEGGTPLIQATRREDLAAIQMLLNRRDLDLHRQDRKGSMALHIAVRRNHPQIVDLLLSSVRLDINCQDSQGNTAFWWATALGHSEISEKLLDDGNLDPNIQGSSQFNRRWLTPPLYKAVMSNNVPLVSRMLTATSRTQLDPNILGDHRWSSVGAAAYLGSREMVKVLLRATNIRINASKEGEDDPLWLAIQRRSTSVIERLLNERERLDINCQNNKSRDTYLLAVARKDDLSLVDKILEFDNVDLHATNA